MKKILSLSPAKIYVTCCIGLFVTLGAFWHHQVNQTQFDRMNFFNQGVNTCFTRVTQTFTAMMIKDIQSPYLQRGFMGLSEECLNETIKEVNPFKKNVGKGYQTLNQLISEVNWFHEKILKTHTPMTSGQNLETSLSPISDRYSKIEMFKLNLIDEIEASTNQIRKVKFNDEILIAAGLIIFIISLSLLSMQEFNRVQLNREIEKNSLNLLKNGHANVGAMVDQIVDRALTSQGMHVTAQVFRDYHGEVLEKIASKMSSRTRVESKTKEEATTTNVTENVPASVNKTSLKEVLVAIQNIQPKDLIHMSEVRDVVLDVPYESFEQMINASINQLITRRRDSKKIMISNQVHSDKSIVNLFLASSTFSAAELEFAGSPNIQVADGIDMNLIILKEMVIESAAQWHLENKVDRNGAITGMSIRITVNRAPKERSKNLVSVIRGKKKDLTRELMN